MKNCPCCGKELTKGHIYNSERVYWTPTEKNFGGFINEDAGEFYLKGNSYLKGLFCGFPYRGYYCSDCELILLPQKEEDEI